MTDEERIHSYVVKQVAEWDLSAEERYNFLVSHEMKKAGLTEEQQVMLMLGDGRFYPPSGKGYNFYLVKGEGNRFYRVSLADGSIHPSACDLLVALLNVNLNGWRVEI